MSNSKFPTRQTTFSFHVNLHKPHPLSTNMKREHHLSICFKNWEKDMHIKQENNQKGWIQERENEALCFNDCYVTTKLVSFQSQYNSLAKNFVCHLEKQKVQVWKVWKRLLFNSFCWRSCYCYVFLLQLLRFPKLVNKVSLHGHRYN